MKHDLISDVMSAIKNGDQYGKREAIAPYSKLVKGVLMMLQSNGYIGDFEFVDDKMGGKFKVQLLGKVNDCNPIRPRYFVKREELCKVREEIPAFGRIRIPDRVYIKGTDEAHRGEGRHGRSAAGVFLSD
jgi:small subunit ribosomal protein S8